MGDPRTEEKNLSRLIKCIFRPGNLVLVEPNLGIDRDDGVGLAILSPPCCNISSRPIINFQVGVSYVGGSGWVGPEGRARRADESISQASSRRENTRIFIEGAIQYIDMRTSLRPVYRQRNERK